MAGSAAALKPLEDLRIGVVADLCAAFDDLIARDTPSVAVDLEAVQFIDSSGLGLLVNVAKRLRDENRYLCLFNCSADVRELLEIAGLEEIMQVYDSREAMRKALVQP